MKIKAQVVKIALQIRPEIIHDVRRCSRGQRHNRDLWINTDGRREQTGICHKKSVHIVKFSKGIHH